MNILKRIPIIFAAVYLLTGCLLYIFQRSFIYFPTEKYTLPKQSSIKQIVIKNSSSKDNKGQVNNVKVLLIESTSSTDNKNMPDQKKALIYFGGNAESAYFSALYLKDRLKDRLKDELKDSDIGYDIYVLNYRGYSGSHGKPSEKAIFSDALTLFDSISEKYSSISLMGRSLGTGVACYMASKRVVEKLILVTPYDSLLNIAQARFPIYPMSILLWDRFDSQAYVRDCVKNIKSGIMIVMVKNDSIIPNINTQRLISKFEEEKNKLPLVFKIMTGLGHNTLSDSSEYYGWLKEFLDD